MSVKIIQCKTVIIGAGMAGIGASLNFFNNNYNDFMVFEALERIGGRVFTDANEKGYLEIGAQWIHGQDGNPIYEVAKKHNLVREDFQTFIVESFKKNIEKPSDLSEKSLHQSFDIKTYPDRVIFPTQYGKKIDLRLASSIYESLTSLIYDAASLKVEPNSPDNRVGDYLWYYYNKLLNEYKVFGSSDIMVNRLLNGLFIMRLKRENIRNGCSNVFDLSLKQFSAYKEFPGHSYVETKRGFGPIIESLIGNNKEKLLSKVHLRHYLKKIILNSDNDQSLYLTKYVHSNYTNDKSKVVLIICDASNPAEPKDFAVVCDRVICTFSLGYLKENLNHFIQPVSLISQERRLSISKLGFGTINKIFLFYDSPFWSKNVELINIIWLPDNENFRVDRLNHRDDSRKLWFENICKFEVVHSMPNCLSAWVAGSEEFEQLDDESIARDCTKVLRRFLGNDSIPMPQSLKRSKWNSNRFSRGSYSHLPLGSSLSDIENIGQPIPSVDNPLILFAGEATEPDYFSTVHGAYLSGIRESNRALSTMVSNDRVNSRI